MTLAVCVAGELRSATCQPRAASRLASPIESIVSFLANLGDAPDTGIELVKQISALIRAENLHTKTIAASVKNKKDAVALAGCDYILLNDRVIANLNSVNVVGAFTNTFQSSGSAPFVKPITKESFTHALKNSPGLEELTHALSANAAADAKLKEFIATSISSGVGQ